jgi:glucuronokinase
MEIAPENLRMVEVARSTGASAKFAGSGGAICGLYRDEAHYEQLVKTLGEIRCTVLKPRIFE